MSAVKKSKTYHFNNDWEEEFFFCMVKDKCICLICRASVAMPKRGNLERHHKTVHKNYEKDFPSQSELRKRKVRDLLACLKKEQAMFTRPVKQSKAATIASFKISHILAKHKKPFEDGSVVKEAFIEAGETLFAEFKNKTEIISAIKELQLSRATVTRRVEVMSQDMADQLKHDIMKSTYFSLQFDESTDITDTAQLCIFIRMVFSDMSAKEEFLTMIPLKGKTRGEDIYDVFFNFVKYYKLPIYKLVCITTDGAPAMIGNKNGFVALCRANDDFPSFFSFHCIIHQQVLCSKVLNMEEIMGIAIKIVNSIRARSLQRRLFTLQLENSELAEHTDLVLHTDVRWLSRGKFLERFQELLPEITAFMEERGDDTKMLKNEKWLTDLAFLTDITMHLNTINFQLQGKGKTIIDMISAINAFKIKLQLMIDQLKRKDLKHFPSLKARIPLLNYDIYEAELSNILGQFEIRFYDFNKLANIASFMSYPFSCSNIEELATEIASQFNMDSCSVENELVQIISDIHLKATASDTKFWCFIAEDKYPNLRQIALQLTTMFGSTYLCESAFSEMKIIKSKYRNRLTDEHMSSCLRLALGNYVPSYEKYAEDMQCHASTSKVTL
ncbi:general transcription factor II-I repeat domain-containing protein 2A-like isoform X1 [Harmonia axyridis]|uniref:general transcription factor II-I repeat domain-containing protein 2A-like isoform X1 n=1 Tax=Harmonia axyridis TaxID=115357 RepID=UPI001E278C7C|nr:general transcription factor II-I repeat domain-containing protein 2A-like isoform X1 [Harmonia axyridis]